MTNADMEKSLLELVKPVADARDAVEKLGKAFETTVKFLESLRTNVAQALPFGVTSESAAQLTKNVTEAKGSTPAAKTADSVKDKNDAEKAKLGGTAAKEAESVQKAWTKAWDTIDQAGHKAFNSIFEKGQTSLKGLGDALRTGLRDMLYEITIKKWVIQLGGVLSLDGVAGLANASGLLGGGNATADAGGGLIGLASSAASFYKVFSDGFAGLNTSLGTAITKFGNLLGSPTISQFGAGLSGSATATSSAAAGAGAAAAPYVSLGAGLIGGHYLGEAISGEYGGQSTVNVSQAAGTLLGALGMLGGPAGSMLGAAVGSFVGGTVGGVLNRAFGMGNKEVTATGIRGSIGASGVDATSYQTWHQDGGWFRSDKNGTDVTPLNAATVKKFNDGFAAIKTVTTGFAQQLGLSADAIASYSKSFDLKLGKDAAANDKLITGLFTTIGNEMAQRIVPNLNKFAKSGETASATLERLAGDFQATNQAAKLIGKTAQEAFGAVGIASAAARERLIDLAGGTSALGQQTTFYAQNFLTEAQRLAPVQDALAAAMADLGLSSVQTRAQFKAVVDSLDLTTESGAKQFTAMMKLAEAFAQVHPATESATDSIASARSALTTAYQNEADAIKATNDRMSNFATNLRKLHDSALLGNLSTLTPEQKYQEAKAQYEKTLGAARAGDADAQSQYQGAYEAFLSASQAVNASGAQYQRDFAYAQAATEEAIQWAEQQVDVGKASLNALNLQVAGLIDVKKEVTSVAQAIKDLASVMGPAGAGVVSASQENAITSLYQSMLHRAPDAAGLKFWEQALASGSSISDIAQAIARSNEYLDHAAGHATMSVQHADVGAQDTAAYLAPSAPLDYAAMGTSNMNALVGEIKALRADNQSLRDEVRGLRSDAERQTGDLMAANAAVSDSTAGKIADATTRAALFAAQTRETRVMPT